MTRWLLFPALFASTLVLMGLLRDELLESTARRGYMEPHLIDYSPNDAGEDPYPLFSVHKFGDTEETTLGDAYDVWNCPSLSASIPDLYPYQSSAYSLFASSDNASDAGAEITVQGLNPLWEYTSETVTLGADAGGGGTTPALVGSVTNWLRVFRAFSAGASALAGDVYLNPTATDTDNDGVPDNISNLQGCILAGENQTQMALYTTGINEWTWLVEVCVGGADTTSGTPGSMVMGRFQRAVGSVFRVQTVYPIHANGTSFICEAVWPPDYIPPQTDLSIRVVTDDGMNRAVGTMDIWGIRR